MGDENGTGPKSVRSAFTAGRSKRSLKASTETRAAAPDFYRFKPKSDTIQSEQEREAAIKRLLEPIPVPPSPKKRPPAVKFPDRDVIRWCLGYMKRMETPRTATEIVDHWYSTWRGHDGRPETVHSKHKAAHVDRVSKWLERHEKAGRLIVGERRGKWNARSYLPVEGADWRRPRKRTDQ
jgi:hypothetical protein